MPVELTKEEKKVHYVRLWKKADAILKQPDNPCQIRRDPETGRISCTSTRALQIQATEQLCCAWCEHWGPNGCKVMALGCKLAWCICTYPTITGMKIGDHPTFGKIKELYDEAKELRLPGMYGRESYEQSFKEKEPR